MAEDASDPRVAPSLATLIRLQHESHGFSFLNRQPVHSLLSGRRASRIRGRGLAFEEIRSYRPGDDIRLIDWRASARTGRTQSRVFTEERDRPVLLVVDLTAAMFFGSRHATKSAISAEVAALSCWRGLRGGDRVGAIIFSEAGVEEFRPYRSRQSVMSILGAIARRTAALLNARPAAVNPSWLNAALHRAEALASHDWVVVVIADLQAADAQSAAILGRIGRHNDIIGIPISDPLERAVPPAPRGGGLATDGIQLSKLDLSQKSLRETVASNHARRLEAIRRGGIRLETPVLPVGTEEAAAPQLRKMLGMAAAPHRRR